MSKPSTSFLKSQQLGIATLTPKVSNLINGCRAKQMEYQIMIKDLEGNVFPADATIPLSRNPMRLTIVVDERGNFVTQYFG
jgi:hypothetical protein